MALPDPNSENTPAWVAGHPSDGVLHEGLDDQLETVESAKVADHVSLCASCRTRVAQAHGFMSASRKILAKLDTAAAEPISAGAAQPSIAQTPEASPAPSSIANTPAAAAAVTASPTPKPLPEKPMAPAPVASVSSTAAPPKSSPKPRPAPVRAARPSRPARTFAWKRWALGAAALTVVAGGAYGASVFKQVATPTKPTAARIVARPEAKPDPTVENQFAQERQRRMATEAVAADPEKRPQLEPPVPAGAAAYDSLVLTRQTCAAPCVGYELRISSAGSVQYVEAARNGNPRETFAELPAASSAKLTAAVSRALLETSSIPLSGRSLCTVFDDAHAPLMRLMVARGGSVTLHANSCKAAPENLLSLGATIDSLAGSDRLQRKLAK